MQYSAPATSPPSSYTVPVRSHRELFAWQLAHANAVLVHRWCDAVWHPARASTLEQLRRASLSVSLNVAEGHAQGKGARCRFHVRVAYGSAVETTVILEFLRELALERDDLIARSRQVEAVTLRLLRSLR